jgi:hypothetical protein
MKRVLNGAMAVNADDVRGADPSFGASVVDRVAGATIPPTRRA